MKRRQFIKSVGGAAAFAAIGGCASTGSSAKGRVVVIGGGYAGATAAKYIRMWSANTIAVTLVEPNAQFISCPISNLVIGGSKNIEDITLGYDSLQRRHGVQLIRDTVKSIDAAKRTVTLAGGDVLRYDRLVVSPGIDFMYEGLAGMNKSGAQDKVLHGWKAGPQTIALRDRIRAMADGETYLMSIPQAPYRCPPGPYERACQVAHYFVNHKPKSKVLILDANEDVTSKGALFKKVWAERYKNNLEYRQKFVLADVDADGNTLISEFGDKVSGAVLNVIPAQRAGLIAQQSGLANFNKRWCEVDFLTFESTQAKNIHVLGDSTLAAPLMPKSGHMANQQAKVCAGAIVDLLEGRDPNPEPIINNTCYSFTTDKEVIHVASVHRYDKEKKTFLTVPGSGGVSSGPTELEGVYAMSWARNIWADTLA